MYRQMEKKIVKQQYLLYMSQQYGELRPTNGWDLFVSLGHPCKFQQVSHLGASQTAALSTGRHLYSGGRPSRWALAHILVVVYFDFLVKKYYLNSFCNGCRCLLKLTVHTTGIGCCYEAVQDAGSSYGLYVLFCWWRCR